MDKTEKGSRGRGRERTGWEAMPRRERWLCVWLTLCVLWLASTLVFFPESGWWNVSVAACYVLIFGWRLYKARKRRTAQADEER